MSFSSQQRDSNGNNHNRKQTNHTDELMRNTTMNQSSTFEKLLIYLTKLHPEYSISDFTDALLIYRQQQQTLAGISLKQIEENILNIIRRKYSLSTENVTNDISSENGNMIEDDQSIAAVLWRTFKRFRERQDISKINENNKEEQCTICLDNLNQHKKEIFSCQHTFHRNCLEEWFKIERTCPLCRTILLFNDEYPHLK